MQSPLLALDMGRTVFHCRIVPKISLNTQIHRINTLRSSFHKQKAGHSIPLMIARSSLGTESAAGGDELRINFSYEKDGSNGASNEGFCIIEGPETVMDFARLQLQEIQDNIKSRRNTIFLLLEEIRRLRIQQRLKNSENLNDENEMPKFASFIPFLPPLTSKTLRQYYVTCFLLMSGIIMFGGLIAPMLELKLGPGGMSYKDFISATHLPMQLSEVDPIVASFSGGAVGVMSSLIVVEINNVRLQEQKACKYCYGTGYLACARCAATGLISHPSGQQTGEASSERCPNCSGTAKVMCPTCLCTGIAMANESDPRFDPFD